MTKIPDKINGSDVASWRVTATGGVMARTKDRSLYYRGAGKVKWGKVDDIGRVGKARYA